MKLYRNKAKILMLVSMLVLSSFMGLAVITAAAESDSECKDETSNCEDNIQEPNQDGVRSNRATDYIIDYYPSSLGTFYAGEENVNLYVRAYHNYNGEEFDPNSDWHSQYDYLHDMKIYLDGVASPPITWDRKNADNNDGNGFDTSYSAYFYYDDNDNTYFQFDIKNLVTPADYQIKLTIKYKILLSYDSLNDIETYSSERTSLRYIGFEIRSGLGYNTPYNLYNMNGFNDEDKLINGGLFYAGTTFQEARIDITRRAWDDDNKLENLEASCSPPSEITICDSGITAKILEIEWEQKYFRFRVDIKNTAKAGIYQFPLTFTYDRGIGGTEKEITEKITAELIIDYTPLLEPPDTGTHMDRPLVTISQGFPEKTFNIEFENIGNVNLKDIKISLDISNAQYFKVAEFYYDEGNYGNEVNFPLEGTISSIGMGNTFSISFSTSVFKQLPSGVYRIPIKYECMYLDSGELVGSSGYTITKEKEYQDIKTAMRVDPPNDLPYICVEVIDTNGIDMEVEALSTFTAGEQNAMLDVKIQNKEYYNLVDLEATLNANVGTPLKNPDNEYKYSLEPVEVGDLGKYGTSDVTIITFVTNIDKDAEGTYYVPIEIKGNDTHNNFVITKNLILKLVVNQRPPDFIVTSVSTTQIKPGKSFTLKVNAKNIGGSTANDVKATLVCSNNVLSPNSEGYLFMNTFIPGQERLIEFDIVASSSLELGITYNINMWLEYNDTKENVQTSTHSLSIKTSSIKSPSPAEVLVVTNMQTTEIRAGNSFTLTLNIRNAGDSDIKNAYVTFSSCTPFIYHNPAGTSTKPGTLNTGFIGVGNTSKAVFNMMVDPDVVQGNAYNCSIVITYMDSLDNQIYSPPYIKPIQLQVKYEGKTSLENRIDEIETEKSTLDMSLTLLAIIILIGIIFITVVFGAILRKRTKTESEKDSTPKPPSTPPVGPSNLPVIPPPKIVRQDTTQPPSKPTQDVFY